MAILAEKKEGERILAPQGNHVARCYSMIHVGTIPTDYMGEQKMVNKIRITWELPNEKHVFNDEKGAEPFVVTKEYTLSMSEKATLRKDLESWRGKAFTEQEADFFDVTKLLGVPAMVNVIHKTSKSGNDYAIVSGVSPMPKGFECPPQINDTFEFNFTDKYELLPSLPQWLREKIEQSEEYKKKEGLDTTPIPLRQNSEVDRYENKPQPTPPMEQDAVLAAQEEDDDDLPF